MKNNLAVNYLLMCASWCLYLNHYIVLGMLLATISCLLIVIKLKRFNYLRSLVVLVMVFWALHFVYNLTSLSSFYTLFDEFSLFVAINVSLSNEMIKQATGNLNLIYMVNILLLLFFMCVAVILPDSWYSIFTKTNIYTLISFIFIPNCITLSISLFSKEAKLSYNA